MRIREAQRLSPKQQVLANLFARFQQTGQAVFTNSDVKQVCQQVGFGNPFDATKIDRKELLPAVMQQQGYCVAHLGGGRHQFIQELQHWFHDFEPIDESEQITWHYRKSLLNDIDRGEASVLSLAINQHILHDFVYEDVVASPKIYIPGRTKADIDYWVGKTHLKTRGLQMEMDLVLEYQGMVTILEAKSRSGFLSNFAVYQLFHPVRFYHLKAQKLDIQLDHINACYIMKSASGKRSPLVRLRLYLYEFTNIDRLDSIQLVRKAEYHLRPR